MAKTATKILKRVGLSIEKAEGKVISPERVGTLAGYPVFTVRHLPRQRVWVQVSQWRGNVRVRRYKKRAVVTKYGYEFVHPLKAKSGDYVEVEFDFTVTP